jgi:hypothetical protein
MATKTAKKPNMFAKVARKVEEKPEKKGKKGTTYTLPKDLDAEGKLQGDSKAMNESVTTVIEAKQEENKAKNKGKLAKGKLNDWAFTQLYRDWANLGVQPEGPVKVANHNGETLTVMITDKTQQNTLGDDQAEILVGLLGEDLYGQLVEEVQVFGFDPKVMSQFAGVELANQADTPAGKPTVMDVIGEIVSDAIQKTKRLTDEQKETILTFDSVTRVRAGRVARLVEFLGQDAVKLEETLDAIGSGVTRYLKP